MAEKLETRSELFNAPNSISLDTLGFSIGTVNSYAGDDYGLCIVAKNSETNNLYKVCFGVFGIYVNLGSGWITLANIRS